LSIQLNGKLIPISGDGHSAFRCLARRLSSEDQHLIIRQQIADYIASHSELFRQAFIDDIYDENTTSSFETYVKILRLENGTTLRNGTRTPVRGQSLALDAASQRYQIGIDVYHFKSKDSGALRIAASFNRQSLNRISLLLSGIDHYDYIEILTEQPESTLIPPSHSTTSTRKTRNRKARKAQRPYRQTKIDQFLNGQITLKACKPLPKQYCGFPISQLSVYEVSTR
jgi:hypothetical protein